MYIASPTIFAGGISLFVFSIYSNFANKDFADKKTIFTKLYKCRKNAEICISFMLSIINFAKEIMNSLNVLLSLNIFIGSFIAFFIPLTNDFNIFAINLTMLSKHLL